MDGCKRVYKNVVSTSEETSASIRRISSKKRKKVKFVPSGVRRDGMKRVMEFLENNI